MTGPSHQFLLPRKPAGPGPVSSGLAPILPNTLPRMLRPLGLFFGKGQGMNASAIVKMIERNGPTCQCETRLHERNADRLAQLEGVAARRQVVLRGRGQ